MMEKLSRRRAPPKISKTDHKATPIITMHGSPENIKTGIWTKMFGCVGLG